MGPILLALLLTVVALCSVRGVRHFLATCYAGGFIPQALTSTKSKLISNQTALAATTTESTIAPTDTRGMRAIAIRYNVSAITGGVADTNYFVISIQGSDDGITYTELAMLSTGQIIAAGSGQMPDAAAEFPVLPRFIRVVHTETGTVTGYAAKVWLEHDVTSPGRQHSANYQGG